MSQDFESTRSAATAGPTGRRPFRFGAELEEPFEGMNWAESAQRLEALGYSTLFTWDHFSEGGWAPIASMAAAAAVTTELKLSTGVFCIDFRHPAVLARELATIDVLSEGRLEVGLGAGYQLMDYRPTGIEMDPPGVRVSRLMEYVAILRGLFAEGPFSFEGEQFTITELDGTPKPFRPGGPPIYIGAGGKRMLTFAARNADIIGVNRLLPISDGTAPPRSMENAVTEEIDKKFAWIREAAGPRFEDLTFQSLVRVAQITDDPGGVAEELSGPLRISPEEVLESPFFLLGSVEEIAERLFERRERWGYSYYTVSRDQAVDFAPIVEHLSGR
ncbi:MAG: TIGR03621 family F420-dependent LLM class oxidoreductase [Solirubrobacterales bacterium]